MSICVSSLAVECKTDKAAIECLWDETINLIRWWAARYIKGQRTQLYDIDDLVNSGFLALIDAVNTFDPEKGKFPNHLWYYVRKHFAQISGTKKQPDISIISLDDSLIDNSKETHADMLPDPDADFADGLIDRIAIQQDFDIVIQEVNKLPKMQRTVIMLTGFDGLSLIQAAWKLGVSYQAVQNTRNRAVKRLCRTKAVKELSRQYTQL
jgi:RNA polymerase sigma factor (sigma-70 family)